MPLVIVPLDWLRLDMHAGHGLGLVHDLGLGVAQAISLVGMTSSPPYPVGTFHAAPLHRRNRSK